MKNYIPTILLLLFTTLSFAQINKSLQIEKTTTSIKIDGKLTEDIWQNAQEAKDFIQFRPTMGVPDSVHNKTIVKMVYDDTAIYVSAYLYDDPSKIAKQFSSRDNFAQSDFFGFVVNPNNDAQNDTEFFVFASGTQADAIANPSIGEDFGWNAVWSSAVQINEDGWSLEMKIPYRCLRFDNKNVETWGIQFHRRFRRDNSQYTWNELDPTKGNIGLYHGELKGLKNLKPPVRLAFYPFVSGVSRSFDGNTQTDFNAGLDVKYGITENFTLDATLIPDFSQAGFDDVSLNLGPFEQTFSEQRQFFTEGVDLFSKANLFFSRRVGSAPSAFPSTSSTEEVIDYPETVKVLNALKVSGRTKNGLGIGLFNSITDKTYATIENTIAGTRREELVEPLTNYNIIVVDQQFNKNSSAGIINTNTTRNGGFRDANVTALFADIVNKTNTYNIQGQVKMSHLNLETGTQSGYSTFFRAQTISGNWRYNFDHSYADAKYDINDLGLQFRNNFNDFGINATYRTFKPKGKWNNIYVNTYVDYTRLANPGTFTGLELGGNIDGTTTTLNNYGFSLSLSPGKQYDYFEPRKEGSFFITKNLANSNIWFNSNDNKKLAISANGGIEGFVEKDRNYLNYWFGFGPRMRFNDKFVLSYFFDREYYKANRGYVTQVGEDVIFGDRDRIEIEQTLNASYNFNPYHTLSLTLRHYWGIVEYDDSLFSLKENGRLDRTTGYTASTLPSDPNINFSTWNFDLSYSWQFAPGSFMTALYRNQLFNRDAQAMENFNSSFNTLFDQPINHTISLKVQYFLDYNQLPGLFKSKKKKNNFM
ncbi:DUF5916 domain-containing protein [Nonlabens sp. Asnod2-A12]|uniref:DUF5916 domain-containing protein n=1 Tax=Nonlabens sp. Asnod2-A12 TaxID=3160578 RepID=UPI00386FA387